MSGNKYSVEMIDDAGLKDAVKNLNTMLLQMGAFVLSNSKRIMNNFIHAINGSYTNDVFYTDTDSLYIKNKLWDEPHEADEARLFGKGLLQGKMITKTEVLFMDCF